MEFHQLKDFVAVANTGSFSKAALKCKIAQPSLSKAILKLEAEIGEELFLRTKRGNVLTSAGETLLKRAIRILNEMESAKREIIETKGLRRGTVNIGILPTISPYFLPRVLAPFTQQFPTLETIVVEETTSDILRLVDACELDLGIVSLPIQEDAFEKETLFKEELLLAVPPNHPLAMKEKIKIIDLERERFILMKEGHCLADQILTFCVRNDLHLQIVLKTSQIETVHSLIVAGLGISLVPEMARIRGRMPLVYRSLEKPKPTRTITIVWRKGRDHGRAASEFLNHLRQTAKAHLETAKSTP